MNAIIIEELNKVEDQRQMKIETASTFNVLKTHKGDLIGGIIFSGFFWSFKGEVVIVSLGNNLFSLYFGSKNDGVFKVDRSFEGLKQNVILSTLKKETERSLEFLKAA